MYHVPHSTAFLFSEPPSIPDVRHQRRQKELQREFKQARLLVIDEKSMIGTDLFVNIDARLKEARPHQANVPFGGMSIILLGDFQQLPPVVDSPLYNEPTKGKNNERSKRQAAGFNLYRLFNVTVNLDKVERQSGDAQSTFREDLGKLMDGTFSKEDWKRWQERSFERLPQDEQDKFLTTGIMACAKNVDMLAQNVRRVKLNEEPIAQILAVNTPRKNFVIQNTTCGLDNSIILSKKTIVRLTQNLWTAAGLCNGAQGMVHSIVYATGQKPPSLPSIIIVTFHNYTGPDYLPGIKGSVPIVPVERKFYEKSPSGTLLECNRRMLPLILGYALSIHKMQGTTTDSLILNVGEREFACGILTVGVTRTKTYQGLCFRPFPNYERFEQSWKSHQFQQR